MKPKAPCKGCEERALGCHSTCERYKEFRAQQEGLYAARKKRLDYNNYLYDHLNKLERKRLK